MLNLQQNAKSSLFAIIDCNSFYVSCERVFNPKLANIPVVVLSNNDGCIISRSQEAKKIGIKMGEPYFKALPLIKRHGVAVFSSNYTLYADMSMRVMDTIAQLAPELEVYSIDEAFISLAGLEHLDIDKYIRTIKDTILKNTGIPVSIGVGATKTLAKVASVMAKESGGAFVLKSEEREEILKKTDVSKIWGIGRRWTAFLVSKGIITALQLAGMSDSWIRKHMSIVGLKTVHELRGLSCIALEEVQQAKKSITVSRSFGKVVTSFEELKESLITFTSSAAEKLRGEEKAVKHITVFIKTNRFNKQGEYYSNSSSMELITASDYTPELTKNAIITLRSIYKAGQGYKRAGIIMTDLQDKKIKQMSLLDHKSPSSNNTLMKALDKINKRYGRGAVFYAGSGITKAWLGKNNMVSRAFTTNWKSLLTVS